MLSKGESKQKRDQFLDRLQKKTNRLIKKWKHLLKLGDYTFTVEYKQGSSDYHANGFIGIACTRASWEYRQATITFWIDELADVPEEDIENIVVHELMHTVVAPISPKHGKLEEFVVENLTMIAINLEKKKNKK